MTKPTGGPRAKVLERQAEQNADSADRGLKPSIRSDIDSFIVMDVMSAASEKEAQGQRIIHMEVGQPGTPAPQSARDAVTAALAAEPLGYSLALGEGKLRKRIADITDLLAREDADTEALLGSGRAQSRGRKGGGRQGHGQGVHDIGRVAPVIRGNRGDHRNRTKNDQLDVIRHYTLSPFHT